MIDSAHPSTSRALGAFEHIIDLYISRNPVQFSIAIELTARVVPEDVVKALVAVQRAHPMLMARIDRTDVLPAFRRGGSPVPLRIEETDDWVAVSRAEQITSVDLDADPLLRAAYVARPEGDAFPVVILTFSHQIVDGRGALRAVHDLLEALEGRALAAQPLPASQEELLAIRDTDTSMRHVARSSSLAGDSSPSSLAASRFACGGRRCPPSARLRRPRSSTEAEASSSAQDHSWPMVT